MTINCIAIDGNVGKDVEYKSTQNGHLKASFSLAHKVFGPNGEETDWFNIQAFGKLAETLQKLNLSKGSYVAVNGRMRNQSYEKDGERKTYTAIVAQSITVKNKIASGGADPATEPSFADDDVPF